MDGDGRHHEKLCWYLAANIPYALWIADMDGQAISYLNPAWESMSGEKLAVGDSLDRLYDCTHPDDRERVDSAMSLSPHGGADFEFRLLRPDGGERRIHARTFAITEAEGKPARLAGIMDDITVRVEETLRVDRLKDEIVSTVSHELRTPMTSIAASLGLLLAGAGGVLPEAAVRLLEIARSNGERLIRLTNDILDIERMESGMYVFDIKMVDILPLVEQTVEANRGIAGSQGARISIVAPGDLPAVKADPDRLAQVLTNLLSNALKFTPAGQEVSVGMEARGGEFVRLTVRDHGAGVPVDFRSRIFEKFAQADVSDTRPPNGTGLGLSIVKNIVTRLGGKVGFDDAPGGGTQFYVDFPVWINPAETAGDCDEAENIILRRAVTDLTLDKLLLHDTAVTSAAIGEAENALLRRAVSDLTVDKLVLEEAARERT